MVLGFYLLSLYRLLVYFMARPFGVSEQSIPTCASLWKSIVLWLLYPSTSTCLHFGIGWDVETITGPSLPSKTMTLIRVVASSSVGFRRDACPATTDTRLDLFRAIRSRKFGSQNLSW